MAVNPLAGLFVRALHNWSLARGAELEVIELYRRPILPPNTHCRRLPFQYQSSWQYANAVVQCRRHALHLATQGQLAGVLIPHPLNLLTNYLARFANRRNIALSLVPDGIANYYAGTTTQFRKKIMIRRALSPLLGLGAYRIGSSNIGLDSFRYDSIFALHQPGLLVPDGAEVRWLQLDAPARTPKLSSGLFIGQPVPMGRLGMYQGVLAQAARILASEGISRMAYKPHPSETVPAVLAEKLESLGFLMETDSTQAEQLTDQYSHFVSMTSSALPNIRVLQPEARCHAIFHDDYLVESGPNCAPALQRYFESAGVFVHHLDRDSIS